MKRAKPRSGSSPGCTINQTNFFDRASQTPCRKGLQRDAHRRRQSELLPQSRRLPVGLSGPHQRSRIHPPDRAGPLHRRLHAQPGVERFPRHSRPHLRPSVRTGLPPRTRGWQTRRHLPAQARRGRSARRHHAIACRRSQRRKTASASPASAPVRRRSPSRTTCCRSATKS